MLTDHNATYSIVNNTTLNTISTDKTNRHLTNVSVYLSAYPLDVYHMSRQFNLVPDVLSRLQASNDDAIRQDEEVEPVLDNIWDLILLIYTETQIEDSLR
jgi:hypothetical protein